MRRKYSWGLEQRSFWPEQEVVLRRQVRAWRRRKLQEGLTKEQILELEKKRREQGWNIPGK